MTVPSSQHNCPELVVPEDVSLTFFVGDKRSCPYDRTDDNVTCDNSMIKQLQTE